MVRCPPHPRLSAPIVTALAALVATSLTSAGRAVAQPGHPPPRGAAAPAAAAHAAAAPAPVEPAGTIVAIDAGELVIDFGARKGARDGDIVELWRPLRLKHPVSGKPLNERFRIGALRLVQVRGTLSLATLEGTATRAPATGDEVLVPGAHLAQAPVVAPSAPAASAAPAPTDPASPAAPAVEARPSDPDAEAVTALLKSLEGRAPGERAIAYGKFAAANGASPYARVLVEEARALMAAQEPPAPVYAVAEGGLRRARVGVAQRYTLEIDARFVGAVLHARRKGTPTYRSIPMGSVGARYWSAALPGDALAEPGLEYFVEGVLPTGVAVALVGSAESPRGAEVETLPTRVREPGQLAQVTLQSEIASFNVKKANDYVFQTEGSVGWRLQDVGIRAVRSGFGVLRGKGGSLRDLDELGLEPTSVGLTYGYVETELAPAPNLAFVLRPVIGLRDGGVTGGAQGFLRIGHDLHTNLSLGGEILGTVGQRGIVQLEWRTIPRVPILLRTEVTTQPSSSSDVGARVIGQVGYQFVRDLTVSARFSYQGRTINHAGPGAGLAASYQW
ncbi:MAG: hypothetical protein IPQ09_09060 [Myxococcales bacterium]|nr:hypothetical protein [Myxococcales bacterium]HQY61478.1 hypothetical protein [Polyangiaceae bacterium]